MKNVLEKQSHQFLSNFLKYRNSIHSKLPVLEDLISNAASDLQNIDLPSTRDEEWRFTNLRPLYKETFVPADLESGAQLEKDSIESYLIPEAEGLRIVFVNGYFNEALSSVKNLPEGVILESFSTAKENHAEIIGKNLGSNKALEKDPFITINSAFLKDGAFLYIPKETKIDQPVHFLYVSTTSEDQYITAPRSLVIAEPYSKFTLVEDYLGLGENVYLSLPVNEIRLAEGASMFHAKVQRESMNAFHINRTLTDLDSSSSYESYSIQLGSSISRTDVMSALNGEQIDCTLDGLVLVNGNQLSDTHTKIDHLKPHCTSHQLHKCIIDGNGHSVFNGKIYVHPKAQKTDSFQENRNILLSETGTVDTKPQLEIYADDVKCSHGATVGQLDQDEVFYLKSRGLDEENARELLSYGFALEIIEQIPIESVRKQLSEAVSRFTKRSEEMMDVI